MAKKIPDLLEHIDTGSKYIKVDEYTTLWPVQKVYHYACVKPPVLIGDARTFVVTDKTWKTVFKEPTSKA